MKLHHLQNSSNLCKLWVGEFEEFKCKNRYINFYQFEIFAIKAAENKENNKTICHISHHNFKNIPRYVKEWGIIEKILFCSI